MADARTLRRESLARWFEAIRSAGRRILAPRARGDTTAFEEVTAPSEVATDLVQTTLSPKAAVFPRCEELLRYERDGQDLRVTDPPHQPPETVLFGVRPCDAAAMEVLDALFSADPPDCFFRTRRARTTVVAIACTQADAACFCTSVGLSPGATLGSDILLTPLDGTGFAAEVLTDKGRRIVELCPEVFGPAVAAQNRQAVLAQVPVRFELGRLSDRLAAIFDKEELWVDQSLRCLGCGTCAFVCPVCACFDIQDEGTAHRGARLRCWDSCGFSLFTLHASGHNPRHLQSQRWRQRVMHKFSYAARRLGRIACVGCGRCSRACPADMNLADHLQALAEAK